MRQLVAPRWVGMVRSYYSFSLETCRVQSRVCSSNREKETLSLFSTNSNKLHRKRHPRLRECTFSSKFMHAERLGVDKHNEESGPQHLSWWDFATYLAREGQVLCIDLQRVRSC